MKEIRFNQVCVNVVYYIDGNFIGPISDISTGGWGPTPIYAIIDDDNESCVLSSVNPINDAFEVQMGEIFESDPNNPLVINCIFRKVDVGINPSNTGNIIDLTIEIKHEDVVIDTFVFQNVSGFEPFVSIDLSEETQLDINNLSGLSIRVIANTTTSGQGDRRIQFCFLQAGTNEQPFVEKRSVYNIDGTNKVRNHGSYVNLQGIRGGRREGWEKYDRRQTIIEDRLVDVFINNRLIDTRYYDGDQI